MIYITQIFGTHLRDTHAFVEMLKAIKGQTFDLLPNIAKQLDGSIWEIKWAISEKGHTILSIPMDKGWFGKENPMFKGEWYLNPEGWIAYGKDMVHVGYIKDFKTLNSFAIHCASIELPLELNEKFEI